jgi:RNA 3'-terminal phosphate cyclase (ATP)
MVSGAKVGGAFEGSPDLRFEPGRIGAGDYRFEIATAGAASLVLQTVLPPLATAARPSRVEVTGGTHVTASPGFEYLSRNWGGTVARMGLDVGFELVRAGFYPRGGGEVHARVGPWARPAGLVLEVRGPLLEVRGISGVGKVKGDVGRRQADATRDRLWEARRIESSWQVADVPAASPGSFLVVEAIFEQTRAAFGFLGERGLRAEVLGDRAARTLLQFLDGDGAVDPHLADQLAVPLAIGGRGGRVTTHHVTQHLVTVAEVVSRFGIPARTWGRVGGPGGLEVAAH